MPYNIPEVARLWSNWVSRSGTQWWTGNWVETSMILYL